MNCLFITIIGAGIFGGTVNFFQLYSQKNKGWINYWKCVILGLGASFLVPLFLQMISSSLVENSKTNDKDLLVFLGFCLIAAIFSRRFIETIGDKILKQVEKANETAQEAKEIATTNKEEVELLTSNKTEVDETVDVAPEVVSASTSTTTTQSPEEKITLKVSRENVIEVLKALKSDVFTFRTLKGIAKDSDINEDLVILILNEFIKRGWVREITRNEKRLFALTEKGNRIKFIKD